MTRVAIHEELTSGPLTERPCDHSETTSREVSVVGTPLFCQGSVLVQVSAEDGHNEEHLFREVLGKRRDAGRWIRTDEGADALS
jgi:hypothetical protein